MLLLSSPSRNCQAAAAQPQAPWFIWQMRVQPQEEQSGFNLPAHQPWATSSSSQLLHIQSAGVPSSLESSWAAFLLTGEEPCGFVHCSAPFPSYDWAMVLKDSCCLEWVDGVRGSWEDLEGTRWVSLPFSSLQAHFLQLPPWQLSRLKQRTAGLLHEQPCPGKMPGKGGEGCGVVPRGCSPCLSQPGGSWGCRLSQMKRQLGSSPSLQQRTETPWVPLHTGTLWLWWSGI